MSFDFYETLVKWPRPYISGTDLAHILDKSPASRYAVVKRALEKGLIVSIRRDLFLIKAGKQPHIDLFEIAPIIYGPSYISYESALSYHGWIPEAVTTTTCATGKRAKEFQTPVGIFSYEHIPLEAFPFGVEQHPKMDVNLFIATPIKALVDLIYSRKKKWESLEDISDDLRVDLEMLMSIDRASITDYIDIYPSIRVKNVLKMIVK
jgi:predicted transcriptional regulator of viral defense system